MSHKVPIETSSLFTNAYSFAGLPFSRDVGDKAIDAFVMGIPYDLGTSGRSGARNGPTGMRQASVNLRWEEPRWPWDFSLSGRLRTADYGDLEFATGNSADMLAQVQEHAGRVLDAGKLLVGMGGDHFVTLPLLRAQAARHGKLALIHFDAHTDTYNEPGTEYNHGCMFYHAPREGLIDPARSVQVGIRTNYDYANHAFEVIDAHAANELSVDAIVARIRQRVGNAPAYLTFDIDCLDPAFAPGTGTPVIGGLNTSQALRILHGLADLDIVGFDLTEVAPSYDNAQITSLAGATLVLQFLYMRASRG